MTTYDIYNKCSRAATKRAKMHALNRLVNVAESIESLSNNYKFTTQFKVSSIVDEQGVATVNSLKADRYKYEVDYCFNVPAVHAFLYKLYENDSQLAQIFASIAEIDAYNAIATKILEGKNSERKFCFAQVIDSWKPQVFSTNYWNVLVSNAVINTLYFDKHADQMLVVKQLRFVLIYKILC